MSKFSKFIESPWIAYVYAAGYGLTDWIPDRPHLKAMFRGTVGGRLDLDNPKTFNEKLQWLKINDRNPLYTTLVDKYRVKQWVADRIGEEHVTKTYAMWKNVEGIDISCLPERFVLKTNHDCGGVAICQNRSTFDFDAAKKKLAKHLKTNYFWRTREWPYRDVKPCAFAEEYLDPDEGKGGLADYKVSCFGGTPKLVEVHLGRFFDHTCDYFTPSWEPLPDIEWDDIPKSKDEIPAPSQLQEMLDLSALLSEGFPEMRVDWYLDGERLIFGELTLFSDGGFGAIDDATDSLLGSFIDLDLAYGNK